MDEITLEQLREKKNLSKTEMAKRLGISITAYFLYETGKRNIPSDTAEKIASILKVSKNKIFLPATFAIRKTKVS